jgi:hypothetical protein
MRASKGAVAGLQGVDRHGPGDHGGGEHVFGAEQ